MISDIAKSKSHMELLLHSITILISMLLFDCGVFLFRKLTLLSVVTGMYLCATSLLVIYLEFHHPKIVQADWPFWGSSLLGRSILLSFLSLVGCEGSFVAGGIGYVLSISLFVMYLCGWEAPHPFLHEQYAMIRNDTDTRRAPEEIPPKVSV